MTRATPKGANRSLREALKARRARVVTYYLPVGDPDEAAAAVREYDQAAAMVERSKLMGSGSEALQAIQSEAAARLVTATEVLDQYRYPIRMRAISNLDYERLINANPLPEPMYDDKHPAPEGWYWPLWDDVLAACAEDSDLTAGDWHAELASWSTGDRSALLAAVRDLNSTPANAELPKG